jgi:hypothetical protein
LALDNSNSASRLFLLSVYVKTPTPTHKIVKRKAGIERNATYPAARSSIKTEDNPEEIYPAEEEIVNALPFNAE